MKKKFGLNEWLKIPYKNLHKYTGIPITVYPTLDELYKAVACDMAERVKRNNKKNKRTSMIIPIGPTMQFPEFAKIVNDEGINCKNLWLFTMDEYLDWQGRPVPENHPMSFRAVAKNLIWKAIDKKLRFPLRQMSSPNPYKPWEYDKAIDKIGGIDVCYAGIGYHGHVAFNEPIISRWYKISEKEFLSARTHIVALGEDTFVINSTREAGGNYEIIPPFAVTVGMKDIMDARELVAILYCGEWQRAVFRKALFLEPTVEFPGSYCKLHKKFSIMIDEHSATPVEYSPY